jgi:hypothetical protein
MDEKRPREPGKLGPVAEGQLELNRELTRRAPGASRDDLLQEQEALQRAQPDAVHAARSAGQRDLAGAARQGGVPPETPEPPEPPEPPEAPEVPQTRATPEGIETAVAPEGATPAPATEPAARSPFADAAAATRDPRSDAG